MYITEVRKLTKTEVNQIPPSRNTCGAVGCTVPLRPRRSETGDLPLHQDIVKLEGTNIMGHLKCFPLAPTWTQKLSGGIRATMEGIYGGVRKHPIKATLIGLTALGAMTCLAASAGTFKTVCYKDLSDPAISWCAEILDSAADETGVYKKFQTVSDLFPSGSTIKRSFEQVSKGERFVYETFTKLFAQNPFKSFF